MSKKIYIKNYIIAASVLLVVILLNIFFIGRFINKTRSQIDRYHNIFIHVEDLQDSISTISGWHSLLLQSEKERSDYIIRRNIDHEILEIFRVQLRVRALSKEDEETKRRYKSLDKNIYILIDQISYNMNNNIKGELEDKVDIEARSISQLIKSQLSLYSSDIIKMISNQSRKLFKGVVFYLSIEILLLIITSISLFISNKNRIDAEGRVERIKTYLDNIINYMPSIVLVINSKEQIKLINRVAEISINKREDDVIGERLETAYPYLADEISNIRTCLQNRATSKTRSKQTFINGVPRFEDITIYPIDIDGESGSVIIIEDITEQINLEYRVKDREEKFKTLIENLGEEYVFYTLNSEGAYAYISPSIEEMLGYTAEDFSKNHLSYLVKSDSNKSSIKKRYKSIKGIKQNPFLFEVIGKAGTNHWIEITEKPIIQQDKVISVEGIAHDITNRINAERELFNYKNSLQELVESRTKELQDSLHRLTLTQDRLIESEKLASLGGLVAGVAHEINTPVGIIITAASHLKQSIEEFEEIFTNGKLTRSKMISYFNDSREITKLILGSSNKASNLIHSFKEIAVDQTEEQKRVFNVLEYLNEILLSLQFQIKKPNITFNIKCHDDLSINSFPGAFTQIITNLISNSLKHGFKSRESGNIDIGIEESNNSLKLVYCDNGIGMTDSELKKIYEPFYTTDRGAGAMGLGMSIVYNIVRKTFLGSIKTVSEPNVGINITIEFDL